MILSGISQSDLPFVFKGGTSLSKAYGLIDRFSEDIDLSMNRKPTEGEKKLIKNLILSLAEDLVNGTNLRRPVMNIIYTDKHNFNKNELEELFLSVGWSSGHYPEKLCVAMKNFDTVFSAYDKDKLVGMVCAMDDGVMNAYVHYLLVNPDYQDQKIGRTLVEMIKEKYESYLRIAVIAYDNEMNFYNNCGFEKSKDASPMFITSLWT